MPLVAGTNLGPYEILSLIATGGMGDVYRARDTRLHRIVAVKISRKGFGERFEREARVAASLNHPNICSLYDVGPDYLVMEFVEGETLAANLRKGRMPLDVALRCAAQIAQAVAAAHVQGIIHRDLKPGNIVLRADGTVKVLDFGIAQFSQPAPTATIPAKLRPRRKRSRALSWEPRHTCRRSKLAVSRWVHPPICGA